MNRIEVSTVKKRLWQWALKIPFAKSFLLVVNSYVWMGDSKAFIGFAPLKLYFKRIGAKFLFCFVISILFFALGGRYGFIKPEPSNYLDTAIQLFPNVLGFGIGAYALLFTFPQRFFGNLEKNREDKKLRIGAQGLNAIMAFPLLAIAVIILAASILKVIKLQQFLVDSIQD